MSRNGIETRNRILETTWKLLETDPKKTVRMSDIARNVGISRQALYLHFPTRAELLIATTLFVDEVKDVDARLVASRTATSGIERLDAFIEAWGNYIPEIYGVGKALLAMRGTDEAARTAWDGRMSAVREGCEAAVKTLKKDGDLTRQYNQKQATDLLWSILSVRTWEHLRHDCGWSQRQYVATVTDLARKSLLGG